MKACVLKFMLLILVPATSYCSTITALFTRVAASYMSTNELAETVLAQGEIVVVDGYWNELRIGDGVTTGGVAMVSSTGDSGWDHTATNDITMEGHKIVLGQGYDITMLNGWGMLSGPGEVVSGRGELSISSYGTTLMSLVGSNVVASIDTFEYDGTNFVITTPVTDLGLPGIQAAQYLPDPDWENVDIASATTGATHYTMSWLPGTNHVLIYRAVVAATNDSLVTVHANLTVDGAITAGTWPDSLATTITTAALDARLTEAEGYTNAAALGAAAYGWGDHTDANYATATNLHLPKLTATASGTNYLITLYWDATNSVLRYTETAE